MKRKIRQLCTFTFANGTRINVVADTFDPHGEPIPFNCVYTNAQTLGWEKEEEQYRGRVKSFVIGENVISFDWLWNCKLQPVMGLYS